MEGDTQAYSTSILPKVSASWDIFRQEDLVKLRT